MNKPEKRPLLFLLILLLAACSGGISGSGGVPPLVETEGFSVGPIDGFGSVILNGVAFDTSGASFTRDGESATQDDLRIGQVVEVEGDFETGIASSVTYRSEVKGPVTSVLVDSAELGLGTLVVLGQTVRVDAQTVLDGTSLELLAPGDLLEVSGPRRSDGSVVATFLQRKDTLAEYKVVGTVQAASGTTFEVGGLLVDYAGADVGDLPGGVAADGDRVEVKADPVGFTPPAGLVASKVELVVGPQVDEGTPLELEGFITDFANPLGFQVLGFPVRTDDDTSYEEGSSASLADGVKVEVEGYVDAEGVLLASSIELKTTGAVRTEWEVEAVDVSASTVTVLGVTWSVRPETSLEDDSDAALDPLTLADLSVGDLVEVRGYLDGGVPVASRLERDDPQTEASLRGPVTSISPGGVVDLEILGIGIRSDFSTIHRDENDLVITQAEFFDALTEGVFVDADWDPFSGTEGAADELSLELDD